MQHKFYTTYILALIVQDIKLALQIVDSCQQKCYQTAAQVPLNFSKPDQSP